MDVDARIPEPLRLQVATHHSLERVLRDGFDVADVVMQDEYTHDVVVAVPGGWLVYDAT